MSRRMPDWVPRRITTSRGDSNGSDPMHRSGVLLVLAGAFPALAIAAGAHVQPGIGRLFFTPEQRVELNRMRDNAQGADAPVPDAADASLEPVPESVPDSAKAPRVSEVTIDGVVMRGDGQGVVWVNGEKAAVGTVTPDGVRVGALIARPGRVRVRIPGERGGVDLEPGQTVVVESGRVLDAYQDRRAARRVDASPSPVAKPVADAEPSPPGTNQVVGHATE